MPLTTELWEHQIKLHNHAIDNLKEYGYAYWLAGCATGKTLAALAVADTAGFKRTLVITKKKPIISVWMKDLEDHTTGLKGVPLVNGTSTDKAAYMLEEIEAEEPVVVIVNYDTAKRMTDAIVEAQFDFVIADESHKVKSHNSQRSLKLTEACIGIPYKLAMTATGWDDNPSDMYSQVRFLSPKPVRRGYVASHHFGRWSDFIQDFMHYYTIEHKRIPTKLRDKERFESVLNEFVYTIDTDDVHDLPPYRDFVRGVELPDGYEETYRELEKEFITNVQQDIVVADNVLTQYIRLAQITSGFYVDYEGELERINTKPPKLTELEDLLDELGNVPVVIFTKFKEEIEMIRDTIDADFRECSGRVDEHQEWQEGEGRILLANLVSAAEGINLTRASNAIYYSFGAARTPYEQSRWRIRRPQSKDPINYWHIITLDTVEEVMYNSLQSKGDIASKLKDSFSGYS